jgi:pimeloyl-ACP methyl ester carboxylesterase
MAMIRQHLIRCIRSLLVGLLIVSPCAAQVRGVRVVDVAGHPMRVRTSGMERLGRTPTIVFEAALGDQLDTWNSIFDQVAALAPAIAYDRAGNGRSPADGIVPTPSHVAQNLHALLATIGARPPYILVGHSWGGLLVRMFSALYPDEVAGIVYIDPTDLRSLDEEVAYYREQGYVGPAMLERKASLLRFPGADRGEFKVFVDTVQGDFKDFRAVRPIPDIPMAVFMSASFGPMSWVNSPCTPRVCEDAIVHWRIKWLRDMMVSSTNATLTVATAVGHDMHVQDPDLIVNGIRRVLTAAVR